MNAKAANVDEYLAAVPDEARATLQELRRIIKVQVPHAAESISYGIPAFRYRGRPLIYFGAARRHSALYGTSMGTVRFPPGEQVSEALVRELVQARMADIENGPSRRRPKRSDAGPTVEKSA